MEGSTPQDQEQPQDAPVEGTPGDQGEPAPADPSAPEQSGGFNPDEAVRTSAPPAEAASGVPDLPGGANEGVEPPSGEPQPESPEGEPEQPPSEPPAAPSEPGDL